MSIDAANPQPGLALAGIASSVLAYGLLGFLFLAPLPDAPAQGLYTVSLFCAFVALVCGLLHRRRAVKFPLVLAGLLHLAFFGLPALA